MLIFNQLPPTAESIEVDAQAIRFLAYGVEDRGINGVAEVCASIVLANTQDMRVVEAIGEKIGTEIATSERSKYPEEDGEAFILRFNHFAESVIGHI